MRIGNSRRVDLIVEGHAYSGEWILSLNGQQKWLDLYSEAPAWRAIPVWRSETPADLNVEIRSCGRPSEALGSEMVFLGIESISDQKCDIDWFNFDLSYPRARVMANPFLTLDERLHLATTRTWESGLDLLETRLRGEGADSWFQIGPYKIFFIPRWPGMRPEKVRRSAATTILESFVWPILFCDEVTPRPGDVVLDVGANIGTTAVVLSGLVGESGHVYAIEPGFGEVLGKTISANGLSNTTVIEAAAGSSRGTSTMHLSEYAAESSLIEGHCGEETVTVEVAVDTIDNIVKSRGLERVDLIKVDIEGFEEEALEGSREVIDAFRPKWTISSYHKDPQGRLQHDRLVGWLRAAGYEVREIEKKHIFAW